jgi:hypothetical protein
MEKPLHDAFRELIKTRKWYVSTTRSHIQAKNDKAVFLKGGYVPEERIRDYLSSAGWVQTRIEMWKKLIDLDFDSE